jgi:hypothetical protein
MMCFEFTLKASYAFRIRGRTVSARSVETGGLAALRKESIQP